MNQTSFKANNETQCFASTSQPHRALNDDYECAATLQQTTTSSTFSGNNSLRFDKNNFPKPLIGIEYVMEITDSKFKEPYYICTLCDKTCDPRNILSQMTSHRHRLNYLELHFPTLMRKLYSTTKFKIDMAYRETVLTEIASKLESKFGRRQPKIFNFFDYERNKKYFHDLVKDLPHYNENDFPSKDLLTNNFETFSDESSTDSEEGFKNYCEKKKKREKKFKDAYIFQKYQSCLEIELKKIETFYKPFERTPEDHPLYSSEWQTFWGKKYNELLKSNKDPNNYDYKPEWVKFWMPRMRELKIQKIEEKKSEICSKLNITNETMKKFDVDIAKQSSSPKSDFYYMMMTLYDHEVTELNINSQISGMTKFLTFNQNPPPLDQVTFVNRQRKPSTSGISFNSVGNNAVAGKKAKRQKEEQRRNNHKLICKGREKACNCLEKYISDESFKELSSAMISILTSIADNQLSVMSSFSKELLQRIVCLRKYDEIISFAIENLIFFELSCAANQNDIHFAKLIMHVEARKTFKRLSEENNIQPFDFFNGSPQKAKEEVENTMSFLRNLTSVNELGGFYSRLAFDMLQMANEDQNLLPDMFNERTNVMLLRIIKQRLISIIQNIDLLERMEDLIRELIEFMD